MLIACLTILPLIGCLGRDNRKCSEPGMSDTDRGRDLVMDEKVLEVKGGGIGPEHED